MQRLTAIDSLRGLLLVLMTINHMPGPHRVYTFDSIGYFTVAEGILHVITQERSCWTMEWDVRPFNENW